MNDRGPKGTFKRSFSITLLDNSAKTCVPFVWIFPYCCRKLSIFFSIMNGLGVCFCCFFSVSVVPRITSLKEQITWFLSIFSWAVTFSYVMWAQNAKFPENNLTSVELSQKWFWSFFANGSSYRGKKYSTFSFLCSWKRLFRPINKFWNSSKLVLLHNCHTMATPISAKNA